MQRQLNTLVTNLRGLDELVRERIDTNDALEAAMASGRCFAVRVRKVASDSMIGEQYGERRSASTILGSMRGTWLSGRPWRVGMHYARARDVGRAQYVAP